MWPVRRVWWRKPRTVLQRSVNNGSVMSGLPGPVIGAGPSGPLTTKDAALFFICPALTRTHCGPLRRERERERGRESGGWLSVCVCVCLCVYVCVCNKLLLCRQSLTQCPRVKEQHTGEKGRELSLWSRGDSHCCYKHAAIIKS